MVRRTDALAICVKAALERVAVPLSEAASAFLDSRGWTVFGHARLADHTRERYGRTAQWLRDMAALGNGLSRLPVLEHALVGDDGGTPLGKVAAVQIARVASAASVEAWVAAARTQTARELKQSVRQARASGSDWPVDDDAGYRPVRGVDAIHIPDDAPERSLVRFLAPQAVDVSLHETLLLHRAVSGTEASLTSLVEAVIGEALSSASPPDVDIAPLRQGIDRARVESILARITRNWANLPAPRSIHEQMNQGRPGDADSDDGVEAGSRHGVLEDADDVLRRLERCSRDPGSGTAAELDARIRELIVLEEKLQRHLGRLLRELADRGAWARLRFHGVGHYAEQRLGLGRTTSAARAYLARALDRFPQLRAAYDAGDLGFEAALLSVRLLQGQPVDEQIERAWVDRATESTIKRLRDEARAIKLRRVSEPGAISLRPLDDADWYASLRHDPGTRRDRVLRLGLRAVADPRPDVLIGLRLPNDLASDLLAAVESRRSELTRLADSVPWHEPWPDSAAPPSLLAARMFCVRCRRTPGWVGLLSLLEDYVAIWDDPEAMPRRRSDKIEIFSRHGWRCSAPACTSRRHLHDHHLDYRSRGGGDETSNRIAPCRFHHLRGEHGDLASCRGHAPLGVVWRLGRRDVAAWYLNERRLRPGEASSRLATIRSGAIGERSDSREEIRPPDPPLRPAA